MRLRESGIFTTEVDGETVILLADASAYLTTNAVGTSVLAALATDVSEDQVVSAIVEEYGVEHSRAARDCREFLMELRQHGLLDG